MRTVRKTNLEAVRAVLTGLHWRCDGEAQTGCG